MLQVSRWDHLKDMAGVLTGFAGHLGDLPRDRPPAARGPDVAGVSDDPEGAEVLQECRGPGEPAGQDPPPRVRPADGDRRRRERAPGQRPPAAASVVVQKSPSRGSASPSPSRCGRPSRCSRARSRIQDQIVHGESGLLLKDPRTSTRSPRRMLADLLTDEEYARLLGTGARSRCADPSSARPPPHAVRRPLRAPRPARTSARPPGPQVQRLVAPSGSPVGQ